MVELMWIDLQCIVNKRFNVLDGMMASNKIKSIHLKHLKSLYLENKGHGVFKF